MSVQKNQPATVQAAQRKALQCIDDCSGRPGLGGLEGDARDALHAGVLPLLVVRSGEAQLGETLEGSPADFTEPRRPGRELLLAPREAGEVNVLVFLDLSHWFERSLVAATFRWPSRVPA